jgi:hypothetical protein
LGEAAVPLGRGDVSQRRWMQMAALLRKVTEEMSTEASCIVVIGDYVVEE